MPIDEALFHRAFGKKKTIARLQSSSLPFKPGELPSPGQHRSFIQSLFEEIKSHRYFPEPPRGYIVHNKQKGVARIVPVFNYRDICVYYFCIKCLEDYIAVNRVEGTFGGWRLGNPIWKKEFDERLAKGFHSSSEQSVIRDYGALYGDAGTYYPARWHQNWGEFQNLANGYSDDYGGGSYVQFDVANFYDSISLSALEQRVRAVAPLTESAIVDLLFHFLKSWNRTNLGYASTNVGVPQDEKSDCSRILANFYLQSYDREIEMLCKSKDRRVRYLRYADDQIIMAHSRDGAREMLYHASIQLHKIGLNLNSGKVEELEGRDSFRFHWCFSIFENLENPNDSDAIQSALEDTVNRLAREQSDPKHPTWRRSSVLKRFITLGLERLDPASSQYLIDAILSPDFILQLSAEQMTVLTKSLSETDLARLIESVRDLLPRVPHNAFHLTVLQSLRSYLSVSECVELERRARAPIGL